MRLISHPTMLLAVGLLAINDHFLRRGWPSALTGKISDFCWLFFFPALLAAIVTTLAPGRFRRKPERILVASMAVTGLVFVSAKTLGPFREWVETSIGRGAGVPISITQDPSDAIALLAFVPLWILAKRKTVEPGRAPGLLAYLVITLGVMLSLANSAAANYGIDCLSSEGVELQAASSSYDEVFISRDGGLTWGECEDCTRTCSGMRQGSGLIQDPQNPAVQYRYVAGETIERSEDGGLTWTLEFDVEESHQATRALFHLRAAGVSAVISEVPLSGIIEPHSLNAVFAMGHDGVLVHVAEEDRWEWVRVGKYGRMTSPVPINPEEAADLLQGEIWLAFLFGLVAVATVMIAAPNRRVKAIAAVLPWAMFLVAWALSPALNRAGYMFPVVILIIFSGYIPAATHLLLFSRAQLTLAKAPWLLGILLIAGIFFLVPYLLWAYALLRSYSLAALIALAMGLAVIVIGRRLYWKSLGRARASHQDSTAGGPGD